MLFPFGLFPSGQQQSKRNIKNEFLKRPLISYTKQTITSPEQWRAELSQIRQLGYAITNEEFAEGVVSRACQKQSW